MLRYHLGRHSGMLTIVMVWMGEVSRGVKRCASSVTGHHLGKVCSLDLVGERLEVEGI